VRESTYYIVTCYFILRLRVVKSVPSTRGALFRAGMAFTQSLLMTDGTLKLDYASVIFVDPGV